jgi:hypothetical protein
MCAVARRIKLGREKIMIRFQGLEKNQAPWHLRWFCRVLRKIVGKDLTPVKDANARRWNCLGRTGMKAGLGRKPSGVAGRKVRRPDLAFTTLDIFLLAVDTIVVNCAYSLPS